MFKNSRYTPHIPSWSKDLEKSIEHYDDGHRLVKDKTTGKPYLKQMRYADDDFCEIGRLSNRERTSDIFFGLTIMLTMLFCIGILLYIGILSITKYDIIAMAVVWICICLPAVIVYFGIYVKAYLVRSVMLPADIPIRFNRQTGKVYVYDPPLNKNYVMFPWKVLMKMGTPEIKVFDWQDISAFTRVLGIARPQWLAACKPGTYEVIDYFLFCKSPALYDEWLWIMEYMEFARELSYQSEIPPTHWVNGLNRRFVPPIIWPEGVDKASKAHSKEELMQIEQKYGLVDKMYPDYIIDEVPRDKNDV